jgi:hypothetical protein
MVGRAGILRGSTLSEDTGLILCLVIKCKVNFSSGIGEVKL